MHYEDDIDPRTSKPEMILTYNDTKGGVNMVDTLCAQYNYVHGTGRWLVASFYSMLNVAGINAFIVYNGNNPDSKKASKRISPNAFHDSPL
ncbi:hypothetical protein NQ314_006584 [Rhamnusium bicolor]|uniref:PiggyBac transposable element-derived protein domain-containing protein n=1 Tax=Rhamnusium bicolor TaxID=1586634 RepID=A0AAV8Z1U0_9CUCU|nr:hypothetical protein NQ314_006584 [Rhamnusium bicolor]